MKDRPDAAKTVSDPIPLHDLNPIFVPAVTKATVETLQIQCFTKVTPGIPLLKGNVTEKFESVLAAVIGVSGDNAKGAISISFPEAVFLGLIGKMFGESFATLNEELETGAGELLNIIYGSVKTDLGKQGYPLTPSIPSVISGAKVRITHLVPSPCTVVPFTTEWGNFRLELGIVRPR